MNTAQIPYISQVTAGALLHYNDCGAGSVLMVTQAYKQRMNTTVDQLYDIIMPAGDTALTVGALQKVLTEVSITNKWVVDIHVHDLLDALIDNCPVIVLVKYAPLVDAKLTEKTGFRGGHFMVVVGVDIKSVCVHDPYWSNGYGKELEIPVKIFKQMWSQCHLDGNPNNGGIVMTIPIQDLSTVIPPVTGVKYTFGLNHVNNVPVLAVNIRNGPAITYGIVGILEKSKTPIVYITTITGEYGKLANGLGWVFIAYFDKA
jgi:hypothetical protein